MVVLINVCKITLAYSNYQLETQNQENKNPLLQRNRGFKIINADQLDLKQANSWPLKILSIPPEKWILFWARMISVPIVFARPWSGYL